MEERNRGRKRVRAKVSGGDEGMERARGGVRKNETERHMQAHTQTRLRLRNSLKKRYVHRHTAAYTLI